jgi:peptidoglycan-associated lipoprotein
MHSVVRPLVIVALGTSLLLGACAKRPAVTVAKAPPPPPPPAVVSPPPPPPAPAPAPTPAPPPAVAAPTPPPAPPVAVAPEPARRPPSQFKPHPAIKAIHFDFDSAVVRPQDAKILDANAAWLKQNPGYLVLIEGDCDERGTEQYNLVLGERRAVAAMSYLIKQVVDSKRFSVVSYGEERPVCTQRTRACWARNRRAEFKVREQ